MSGRKLGGGRVLGSGRSLSPAVPAPPQHQRSSSLLSPAASTISFDSSSTSNTTPDTLDLKSQISFRHNEENVIAAATASSRLFCPICNEEMVTLLQLNR
jgi:rabenosyn-5